MITLLKTGFFFLLVEWHYRASRYPKWNLTQRGAPFTLCFTKQPTHFTPWLSLPLQFPMHSFSPLSFSSPFSLPSQLSLLTPATPPPTHRTTHSATPNSLSPREQKTWSRNSPSTRNSPNSLTQRPRFPDSASPNTSGGAKLCTVSPTQASASDSMALSSPPPASLKSFSLPLPSTKTSGTISARSA